MYKVIFSLLASVLFFASCGSSKNTLQYTVASERGDCVGVAPMKCYLIKQEGQRNWEFLYNEIDGFNYVPGYEYVIDVRTDKIENPAADQSSIKYVLVKEISKVWKTSENLPQ